MYIYIHVTFNTWKVINFCVPVYMESAYIHFLKCLEWAHLDYKLDPHMHRVVVGILAYVHFVLQYYLLTVLS